MNSRIGAGPLSPVTSARWPEGRTTAGTRLEAEVYIITSSATAGQNLRKAVSRAGYRIAALVHEPLAAAMAVLTEDEKEVGTVLVDLGAGSTEVAVFRDGKTRHLASVPWGGFAVTNDLVKGLSIPFAEAERAKEQYGAAQFDEPRLCRRLVDESGRIRNPPALIVNQNRIAWVEQRQGDHYIW